ncbi:phosphate acyltransferase PlsX [Planktothrix agardhii]|jgi:glycerol-3-phosphate acyltransferase PlsX|uniref:Phosphate acyltransferase n=2 Tax=Planktothrix agardhii TaxID=1160 RepID=A0A073CQT7_PLAA1|nr:phosphate acyltransferase PlsX [Planktothrix agardhii]BBD55328.1 fatty acid/phospholipid synthesis protein PlsX [Planktothrix agardhii NIES-204]KEI66355.1 PlsX [Planktothrix agardhii NIVA-CYA 126/8]MCB8777018.1 phosphate acyltransferase PlsX [Planktothrix agardhii 1031]MCF3590703.1 phosphate acyltransferase PlsX [Planktothrix agardhii 1029]MCF3599475.1 phosphate acyltransferase PlsX [Planktothrix agardhii 1032]
MSSTRARIAIDAMGGDHAPADIVAGALMAQEKWDVEVLLVGDPDQIEAALKHHHSKLPLSQIIPAEGMIEMHEEALSALKRKPKASINVAMNLVRQKKADAVVSAGHSGAAMASALLRLGRLPGIDRPAIGAVLPTMKPDSPVLVLDVGANVDCRPKFLEQFAVMGSIYSRYVLGTSEPKVGLLNIGEESCKGNDLAIRTYQLLENHPEIAFNGNAEGRDVLTGKFDVIVCDGFVGNVLLKFAEGVGEAVLQMLKEELTSGLQAKLGTTLLKPSLMRFKQRVDHVEHGGALLLGVAGVCIISHGSSKAATIANAVRLAKEAIDNQVLERIQSQYQKHPQPDEKVISG